MKTTKIVWQVCSFVSGRHAFSSYSEAEAVAFARALNVGPVPVCQVERSLIIGGRAV